MIVTLVAVVLTGGCESGTASTSPSTAGSTGAGSTGSGSTKAVCDEVKRVSTESGRAVSDALAQLAAARLRKDDAATKTAEDQVRTALRDWASKLSGPASQASDPKVRQDLTELGAAIKKVADEPSPSASSIDEVRTKAAQACG
jgi:hypothetical protein